MKKNTYTKVKKANPLLMGIKERYDSAPVKTSVSIAIFIALVTGVISTVVAWNLVIVEEKNLQAERFSQQYAKKAVSNVEKFLGSTYSQVGFFSRNTSLENALLANNSKEIERYRLAILGHFPNAEGIRLIPKGTAKVDLEAELPFTFADLDMINMSERREKVFPEAKKIGKQLRLNFVVTIPHNVKRPVAGTLLMTIPIDGLKRQLGQDLENLGHIKLVQIHEGRVIYTLHQTGKKSSRQPIIIPIKNTPWEITYTPSASIAEQGHIDYLMFGLICFVALLLGLAIFIFIGLFIGRRELDRQQAIASTMRTITKEQSEDRFGIAVDEMFGEVEVSREDEQLLSQESKEDGPPIELNLDLDLDLDDEQEDDSKVPRHIFREYDIRGIYKTEITHELAIDIGKALGSEAIEKGENHLVVGRDTRTHSPILSEYLIRGILSTGCHVKNLGTVPTPLVYYAAETFDYTSSGVMVTASHNPKEFNGFKVVMNGKVRSSDDIKAIRSRILGAEFREGHGEEEKVEVVNQYIETIFSDVALASDIHVVLDAGNGAAGQVAPELFAQLGCEVTPLFCDFDGTFPNRGPDPSVPSNLDAVIERVKESGANLGVAFDGDGDRLVVVTPKGKIIWPDRLLMLFAKDILARHPGADVVFDVKCTRQLNQVIVDCGGRPIMWKTGHSLMKNKMQETGAMLGGEYSGHIFIKDRWYGFDDAMYAAARLIEIISLQDEDIDLIFDEFPELFDTPEIRVSVPEDKKFQIVEDLIVRGNFGEAKKNTLDGLRVDFVKGWGLVRASNTSAALTLRVEAEDREALHSLKALFTRELRGIDNSLEIKW